LGVKKWRGVSARLHGANCAASIARRDLRCAIYAVRSCAVELKSEAELKSGARRGGGEQALVIPDIAISVDVDFDLCVIYGTRTFAAATIVMMNFAFLLVFVFAVVGVLLWLFPGVTFAFF
jgi:hypothetical protein